jgi:hypothetical protein
MDLFGFSGDRLNTRACGQAVNRVVIATISDQSALNAFRST